MNEIEIYRLHPQPAFVIRIKLKDDFLVVISESFKTCKNSLSLLLSFVVQF